MDFTSFWKAADAFFTVNEEQEPVRIWAVYEPRWSDGPHMGLRESWGKKYHSPDQDCSAVLVGTARTEEEARAKIRAFWNNRVS